jgi:hypothetical protein
MSIGFFVVALALLLMFLVAAPVALAVIAFPHMRSKISTAAASIIPVALGIGVALLLLGRSQSREQPAAINTYPDYGPGSVELEDLPAYQAYIQAGEALVESQSALQAGEHVPPAPRPVARPGEPVAPIAEPAVPAAQANSVAFEDSAEWRRTDPHHEPMRPWVMMFMILALWIGLIAYAIRKWSRGAVVAIVLVPLLLFGMIGMVRTDISAPRPEPAVATEAPAALGVSPAVDASGGSIPVESGNGKTADESRIVTVFSGQSDAGRVVDELPDWVENSTDPDVLVVRSRFTDNPAAAQEELIKELRPRLAKSLQETGLPVNASELSLKGVRESGLVTARVREQTQVQAGEFTVPVFRETWQVKLDAAARESLARSLLPAIREHRVWQLGGVLAALTLVLGAWAAYFQIDDATRGRHRGRLKLAAAGAIAATGAFAAALVG